MSVNAITGSPAQRLSCLLAAALLLAALALPAVAQDCPPERTLALAMDLEPESPLFLRAQRLYDNFFARIGWCVDYRISSFTRSMEQVRQGKYDGDYFRIKKYEDYVSNVVRVDEPIAVTDYCIYARDERFKGLTSREAFRSWNGEPLTIGYSQGIIAGMEAVNWLREYTRHQLYNVPDQFRGMRMLAHGRLDIFMGTHVSVEVLFDRLDLDRAGVSRVGVFATNAGYIYLNKRLAFLVPELERAIRAAKEDGTFERVVGFPPPVAHGE